MESEQQIPIPKELWDTVPPAAQAALLAVFQGMQKRIVELETRVADLEARLNQNSRNSSKPPSTEPVGQKRRPPEPSSGRKRGGQQGHQRNVRPMVPPERVAEVIDHQPAACRKCGQALHGCDPEPLRHQVAELPPIEPIVVEHRLHRLECSHCGVTTCATLPADVPHGSFGPRLQGVLALLSGAYRISKRGVQQLAADVLELSISTGMVAKLEQSTAQALQEPYEEMRAYVKNEHVNIDETGWKENRKKAYLWTVVGPLVTVFAIARRRSATVAKTLLGAGYRMVATCDRYSGYFWINRCQICWAHLRRDFQAMIDRGDAGKPIGQALLDHSNVLFSWWHRVRDGDLSRSTFQKYASNLRAVFLHDLERGTACGCAKTEATCRELLKDEPCLWRFLWVEGIEPTNNAAERSLRHAVIWRKCSGGTDSPNGSRFVERILSAVATCRQQNRNLLDYLIACIDARQRGQSPPSLLPAARDTLAA